MPFATQMLALALYASGHYIDSPGGPGHSDPGIGYGVRES
jgi:hypothetical protein